MVNNEVNSLSVHTYICMCKHIQPYVYIHTHINWKKICILMKLKLSWKACTHRNSHSQNAKHFEEMQPEIKLGNVDITTAL